MVDLKKREEVSRDVMDLFRQLYGFQSTPLSFGFVSDAEFKGDFIKLLQTIKIAMIHSELQTDKLHFESLIKTIDSSIEYIKKQKDREIINGIILSTLSRIVFLLIGEIPNNYEEGKDNKGSWSLNKSRQIIYIQKSRHKEEVLFRLAQSGQIEGIADTIELNSQFLKEKMKKETKIEWFERTRPSEFLSIFGRKNE